MEVSVLLLIVTLNVYHVLKVTYLPIVRNRSALLMQSNVSTFFPSLKRKTTETKHNQILQWPPFKLVYTSIVSIRPFTCMVTQLSITFQTTLGCRIVILLVIVRRHVCFVPTAEFYSVTRM